jgi:hypothetical protein
VAGAQDLIVEERGRDLHVDARAVAGLAIGIDGAPVPDGLQRVDAVFHHLARRLAVDRHDKTHAAGRMLLRLGIQPVFGHPFPLRGLGGGPIGIILGHDISPST